MPYTKHIKSTPISSALMHMALAMLILNLLSKKAIEVLTIKMPLIHRCGKIVPIYPQSEKAQINTWEMAGWVEETLRRCAERGIADPVPEPVRRRLGLIDRSEAFAGIHLPDDMKTKELARYRLAFDELLRVQLVLVLRKRALERDSLGIEHAVRGEMVQRFTASLPFPMTAAQQRTIAEINADLASGHPMHRLLQGDVGAGKTVVAVAAMLAAVDGGHQSAFSCESSHLDPLSFLLRGQMCMARRH